MTTPSTLGEVVRSDLCIGCGLCESVTGGRVSMTMTPAGSLRPMPLDGFTDDEERAVLAACPGVVAEARDDGAPHHHQVWGGYRTMVMAWAGDPDVRFRSSTGGVLTALGQHLLRQGTVASVLHVGPDPAAPTRSRWILSRSADDVLASSGSRYGPTAPLAGLVVALDRGEPFAIIAKPCDLGAVHRFAAIDERVDRLCVARLAMVCGGQSRLTKTLGLLDRFGVTEHEVASLRYRGNGNPGPTRVETTAGEAHETTYLELWADETRWDLETRCKLCPDALGECADVAALDTWPGGAPTDPAADDDGFNAIVVRTSVGERLVGDAVDAGELVLGEPLTPDQLDDFQPHQVRRKVALAARYEGVADAGVTPIETVGLRIEELGRRFGGDRTAERAGTHRRMTAARR
jgi:coenzyme F420 hydrogenase subunit beta